MAVLSDRAIAVVRDSRFLLWEYTRPPPAQEKQSDFTPNCPESALSSRCRSGEDILLVRLWPIQEATFLRWLAQGYGYCPRRVDSGRDQQILFLWLQTFKNRTPLRWQPRKTLKERGGAPISLATSLNRSCPRAGAARKPYRRSTLVQSTHGKLSKLWGFERKC